MIEKKIDIKNCFITPKDHKRNFLSNLACRLINASKTKMGNISK